MRKSIAVIFGTILAINVLTAQTMPRLLNYQGKLTTSLGVPVDGTRDFQFSLFTNISVGSALWTEHQTGVQIQKGYYSIELGSKTAFPATIDFLYGTWYLGVYVRTNGATNWGSELLPRTRILPGLLAFSMPPVLQQLAALSNQGVMASNLWQTSPLAGVPAGNVGKSNVFFVDREGRYDFTDIQAALDRAASLNLTSSTIYVLSGTYPITAPITYTPNGRILHNVSIIGDSINRPVVVSSFDDYALRADTAGTSPTNILLANISFGTSALPLKRGVYWNTHRSKISNCTVYSSVSVKGNSNRIMNNYIENNSGDALSVEGLSNIVINNTLSGYCPSVIAYDIYSSVTSSNSTVMSNNLLKHGTIATPTNTAAVPGTVNYIVDASGRYDFDNIQSALEAVADGQATNNITNAVIRVYSGIYQISSSITLKANGKVLSNVTIKSFDATAPQIIPSMNDFTIKIAGDNANQVKNIILSNIVIGTSTTPVYKGLLLSNAAGCKITNNTFYANNNSCTIAYTTNSSIYLPSTTGGTVQISHTTNSSFYFYNTYTASIQNSDNCRSFSCSISSYSNVTRCVFSNGNFPSSIISITSNSFYNVTFSNLRLSNSHYNSFKSCTVSYASPIIPLETTAISGHEIMYTVYNPPQVQLDDSCVSFKNSMYNTVYNSAINIVNPVSGFCTGTVTGLIFDASSLYNNFSGSTMSIGAIKGEYNCVYLTVAEQCTSNNCGYVPDCPEITPECTSTSTHWMCESWDCSGRSTNYTGAKVLTNSIIAQGILNYGANNTPPTILP
ncbi:MAG: hypothetical protein HZC28_18530 [Spirochaetes bacterium]|nr:hypothetical protein [Spirochaetota bacterium]